MLFHPSRERTNLTGGAHTHGNDASQQVGGNSQPRAFGDVIHPADNLNAVAGPSREARQQIAQRLRGPLDSRRDNAAGDHARFQQA
jgi:hypothetical protein